MLFRVIFFLFLAVLPCSQAWSAPTQQRFNDWQVTCNNQNFCVTRNVGLHHGLVMTLSRSAGAVTDASLRIELGGTGNPVATLAPIAPRLLLDGKPVSLTDKRWHIEDKLIKTADSVTIDAFLQQVQEGKALSLANGLQTISLQGLKAALFFIDDRQKRVGSETAWVGKGEEPPLSVPPAPALRAVATAETAQSPLGREELNDLMDYGNERMTNSNCSLDPFRREIRVTALTDDKVLLIDDFMANGKAMEGLIQIVKDSGAQLVGAGIVIEKGFQRGGDALRDQGVHLESLAIVESMDEKTGEIVFR